MLNSFTSPHSRKPVPASCPDASETGVTFPGDYGELMQRIERARISGQRRLTYNPDKGTHKDF